MKTIPMRLSAAVVLLGASFAPAATVSLGSSNDTWIRDGRSHAANGVEAVLDSRLSFVPYVQFDLFIDGIPGAPLRLQNKGDVSKWIAPAGNLHGGRVNAVFADLHVEPLDPAHLESNWKEMITPSP